MTDTKITIEEIMSEDAAKNALMRAGMEVGYLPEVEARIVGRKDNLCWVRITCNLKYFGRFMRTVGEDTMKEWIENEEE